MKGVKSLLKFVLDDYRGRFWTALKSILQIMMLYFFWIYVYIGIIMKTDMIRYSIGILPMLTGFFLSRMYPNQLHKLMFLCPMSNEDRKKYMITAYGVRIGISMTVFAALSIPALIVNYISIQELTAAGLLVLIYVSGANMHHPLLSMQIARTQEDENYWISLIYALLSVFSQIAACLAMVFLASCTETAVAVIITETAASLWRKVIVMILTDLLLNAAICIICFRPVMEYGMNYEKCFAMYAKKTRYEKYLEEKRKGI